MVPVLDPKTTPSDNSHELIVRAYPSHQLRASGATSAATVAAVTAGVAVSRQATAIMRKMVLPNL